MKSCTVRAKMTSGGRSTSSSHELLRFRDAVNTNRGQYQPQMRSLASFSMTPDQQGSRVISTRYRLLRQQPLAALLAKTSSNEVNPASGVDASLAQRLHALLDGRIAEGPGCWPPQGPCGGSIVQRSHGLRRPL